MSLDRVWRRVQNMVAWGSTQTVMDDSKGTPTVQAQPSSIELQDGMQILLHFGFSSSPPKGSRFMALFGGGDRAKGTILGTVNAQYRRTGLVEGEVVVHDMWGNEVHLAQSGITIKHTDLLTANMPRVVVNAPTSVIVNSPQVTVNAPATTTVNSPAVTVNAPEMIALNSPVVSINATAAARGGPSSLTVHTDVANVTANQAATVTSPQVAVKAATAMTVTSPNVLITAPEGLRVDGNLNCTGEVKAHCDGAFVTLTGHLGHTNGAQSPVQGT